MRKAIAALAIGVVLAALCAGSPRADDEHDKGREVKKYPNLKIIGFTDFNFFANDRHDDGEPESGFKEGQFVLHFVSELAEQLTFFSEVSISAKDSEFKTEVERVIIDYERNDFFGVGGGRFHTPITWWNVSFHHGAWLQTTVTRPEMTRFGAEFIPIHFVGVMADGAIPSGSANLGYAAGVGNGRSDNITRGGDAGDVNNNRAWIVKIKSQPDALYGLEVGGAFYSDKITPMMGEEADEQIASAYVVFTRETPEVLAEYVHTYRVGEVTRRRHDSDAYYIQVAWRLPVFNARLKPYGRWEAIDVDSDDPLYGVTTDMRKYLFGVRADVSAYVALKLEYARKRTDPGTGFNEIFLQAAITF